MYTASLIKNYFIKTQIYMALTLVKTAIFAVL